MKGLAFRKLGRTSSHRHHLLRNLVTSLLTHERISTTVAKAKEAQREAEKIITLIKRDTPQSRRALGVYLYAHKTTMPLLPALKERYATRPGGYTRVHLFGHRAGDHAPRAILELVDNPRDLKFEIVARAMGRSAFLAQKQGKEVVRSDGGPPGVSLRALLQSEHYGDLTKRNLAKLHRFGGQDALERLVVRAAEHAERLAAIERLEGPLQLAKDRMRDDGAVESLETNGPRGKASTPRMAGRRLLAGQRVEEEDGLLPYRGRRRASGQGRTDRITRPRPNGPTRREGGKSVIRVAQGIFAKRGDSSLGRVRASA